MNSNDFKACTNQCLKKGALEGLSCSTENMVSCSHSRQFWRIRQQISSLSSPKLMSFVVDVTEAN